MARSISDADKIQGNSLPEIRDCWQQASLDLSREPEIREAAGGALRPGNLLNAFALWCLSRPDEERKRIAVWGLRALERIKQSDQVLDLRRMGREDFEALGGISDPAPADSAKARKPSKRTG